MANVDPTGVDEMTYEDSTIQAQAASPRVRRIPVVAEALGYVGGALALTALVVLMSMFWSQLGMWGRSGIAAAVGAAGLLGGLALERLDEPAAKRLAHFLLALAAVGVGCAVGFVVDGLVTENNDWPWFAGTLTVAACGGFLWVKRPTWLQHLVFGGGVAAAVLCLLPLIPIDGPEWGPGLVLSFVGVVWGALALKGRLAPDNAAYLLASSGILVGILMASSSDGMGLLAWAVYLGLVASAALIWVGAKLDRLVVLGVAAAGFVMFTIPLLGEVLDIGMGMPIAFLVVGIGLLACAVWATRRSETAAHRTMRIVAEVAGYAGAAFLLIGVTTMLGEYWNRMNTAGRIALPALATVVAWGFGLLIERTQTDSARRLSQLLFGAGAVGVGGVAAMIVRPIAAELVGPMPVGRYVPSSEPGAWAAFAGGASAFLAGGVAWWFRKGGLTLLAFGGACIVAIISGFNLVTPNALPYWLQGAVLLAVGLVWLALSLRELLAPSNSGLVVASVMVVVSAMVMTIQTGPGYSEPPSWPMWLGLAIAVALIVASIALRRGVMLGFGAAGVVWYAFRAVERLFEGRIGAPIMLLIVGVIFIGMAVLVAVVLPKMRRQPSAPPA